MFVLLLTSVSAIMNDYLVSEVDGEGNMTGSWGYTTTNQGCELKTDAGNFKVGSGAILCIDSDYLEYVTGFYEMGLANQGTLAMWVKVTDWSSTSHIFSDYNAVQGASLNIFTGEYASVYLFPEDNRIEPGSADVVDGNWHLIVAWWNSTTLGLTVDNSINDSVAQTGIGDSSVHVVVHRRGDDTSHTSDIYYDGICIWDETLNSSARAMLYNSSYGMPCDYEEGGAAPPPPSSGGKNQTFTPYFELTTNLSGGNYTDNPFSIQINGTINYSYSGEMSDYELVAMFTGDTNATSVTNYSDYTVNKNHGNISGALWSEHGHTQGSYYFDGINDTINLKDSDELLTNDNAWSIMAWFNATNINTTDFENRILTLHRAAVGTGATLSVGNGDKVQVRWHTGALFRDYNVSVITENTWHHIGLTWDGSDFNIYFDGVLNVTDSDTFYGFGAYQAFIGGYDNDSDLFYGYIDEVRLYNTTLTTSQMSAIYNSSYPEFTCSLTVNSTEVNISSGLNISQQYSYLNLDTTGYEGSKRINLTCTDQFMTDSDQEDIWYDLINPVITLTSTLGNNSILTRHIDQLIFNLTCTDTYLYGCGYSITKLNGDGTDNMTMNSSHVSNIPDSSIRLINFSLDFTNIMYLNWTDNKYRLTVSANDSHTDIYIPDYNWETYTVEVSGTTYKGIRFNNNVFNISTDDYTRVNDFALVKKADRYIMALNIDDVGVPFDLFLDSKKDIIYLPNSPFQGHFLIGNHWIDFVSDDVSDFTVTYIEQYGVYRVRFTPLNNLVIFRSIGDMNKVQQDYFFNISSGFTFYAVDGITTSTINNMTIFILNGSNVIQNKSTSGYNITFNITSGNYSTNITAGGYANNKTGNLTFTNGGSFTYTLFAENSLYLFFYDESTDAEINTTNIFIQVISPTSATQYNTSTGALFVSGFATGDYELRYWGTGYRTNAYFTTIATSSTQSLDLYLIKNTSSSLIVFELSDEKGFPISNATLKAQRFMLADNAYVVVSMSKSDSNGETGLYLEPNDIFYKFIVENSKGIVIFRGAAQKIFSSTQLLKINILEDVLQSLGVVRDSLSTNLSWNNNTRIISYFFNEATGLVVEGCVEVIGRTSFTESVIKSSCTKSSSATIELNLTGLLRNNTQYLARGYVHTNTTSSKYFTDLIEFVLTKPYQKFGQLGLFLGYLFIGTMFFLGLPFNFSVAVVYSVLSMIMMQLVGVTYFGWAFIITTTIIGFIIAVVNKI